MRDGIESGRALALALSLLAGLPLVGSAQTARKPSIMIRWPNLVIAVRPSDTYGVTLWLGLSLEALPEKHPVNLRGASFRPDDLNDWLPFARAFLEENEPTFGARGYRTSPALSSEEHRVLGLSQEAAPPPNEPDYLLFFSDSGGTNRLVVRTTRDHLRNFLAALQTARASASWAPDTTRKSPADNCVGEPSALQPVTFTPGNHLSAPPGVTGQGLVVANYFVDTSGRAEPSSLDIIYSDHKVLSDQLRRDLAHWRFHPASCHGVPFRQEVSQAFSFRLSAPEQK